MAAIFTFPTAGTIDGFDKDNDILQFGAAFDAAHLVLTTDGTNTIVTHSFQSVIINGLLPADFDGTEFLFDDGSQYLQGDAAADTFGGTVFNDQLRGGDGNDVLSGADGNDRLDAGAGDDLLQGGDESDALYGGAAGTGSDTLEGGAGADVLYAQGGATTLTGGADGDEFVVSETGTDVGGSEVTFSFLTSGYSKVGQPVLITDFDPSAGDTIRSGITDGLFDEIGTRVVWRGLSASASFTATELQAVSLTGSADGETRFVELWTSYDAGADQTVLFADVDMDDVVGAGDFKLLFSGDLTATLSAASFSAGTFSNASFGTPGADTTTTPALSAADDLAFALGGDDTLAAGEGNDEISGDEGNDELAGEGMSDILAGGTGSDSLSGGDGDDDLYAAGKAGPGAVVDDAADDNTLSGGAGFDVLAGSDGDDTLDGGDDGDSLDGGLGGSDSLQGGNGDDTLHAAGTGPGADTLDGGAGSDRLSFGAIGALLTLTGGTDADRFVFELGGTYFAGGAALVTVTDFNPAEDLLELSDVSLGKYQSAPVVWQGAAPGGFTATLGESVTGGDTRFVELWTAVDGADVVLYADTNRDGVVDAADFRVAFQGSPALTAAAVATGTLTVILGTPGDDPDAYFSLGGNADEVYALAGNDTVSAGAGMDTIQGDGGNDILDGGDETDMLYGGDDDDSLVGAEGFDTLQGGAGADTLDGGDHEDVLAAEGAPDSLSLTTSTDLPGTANLLRGGAGNDTLSGGAGDDTLEGGTGADAMSGGDGNDLFRVDDAGDVAVDSADSVTGGNDQVIASVSQVLGTGIEQLRLTGTANLDGTGNALANTLRGNAGDNVLDGKAGADSMVGGTGDDKYFVDHVGDVVSESGLVTGGHDTVVSSVSRTLGNYQEDLSLVGKANANATGNGLENALKGNAGNNVIDGRGGHDTMVGGTGNDKYYVDNAKDQVLESGLAAGGNDTVVSSVSRTLGNFQENLELTGSGNLQGNGNALDNALRGNAGDNLLDGRAGEDSMTGGAGNDTYHVDDAGDTVTESVASAAGGRDTVVASVSQALGRNVEDLRLTGATSIDGTGNGLANSMRGNGGNNVLNGRGGADSMVGGTGNDRYIVDNAGDRITESGIPAGGHDVVVSSVTQALGLYLEDLTLSGATAINGTGNDLDNYMRGNAGDNALSGRVGADTMAGGRGNDTYHVDSDFDLVLESPDTVSGGHDTVIALVSYALGNHVEDLRLAGWDDLDGTGNGLDNELRGNDGWNELDGGVGRDTMIGGRGDDHYLVDNVLDVVIETEDCLCGGIDVVSSSVSYALSANLDDLELVGTDDIDATGNGIENFLIGNDGNNRLDGRNGGDGSFGPIGGDTMIGMAGDDTYVVNEVQDVVVELDPTAAGGHDLVISSIDFTLEEGFEDLTLQVGGVRGTGNDANNVLKGNLGPNVLDGGLGADTMNGGTGSDTYYVDEVGDVVIDSGDLLNGGHDLVVSAISYTLADVLEELNLTGVFAVEAIGNARDNVLRGNGIGNAMDGRAGADTMGGGLGDDTYGVDDAGDVVVETDAIGGGHDLVESSVTFVLGAFVELLTLTGAADVNGTGNALDNVLTGNDGVNDLRGNSGNDTLYGYGGNDTLRGGLGADVYYGLDGQDTYDINSVAESDTAAGTWDTIAAFIRADGDLIELRTIDANDATVANEAFSFIGNAAFSATDATRQLRWEFNAGTGSTFVYGSTDADAQAEFAIEVFGVNEMFASDFIL